MNIDERGKDQAAQCEIAAQHVAGKPPSGKEKHHAAQNENSEIGLPSPRCGFGCCLATCVVIGDPQILQTVHHGQDSRAVRGLRYANSSGQLERRRHDEP